MTEIGTGPSLALCNIGRDQNHVLSRFLFAKQRTKAGEYNV